MNTDNYCYEHRKFVGNLKKHLVTVDHKTKLYQRNYDKLCQYGNCMHLANSNGFCKNHKNGYGKKIKKSKFKSLEDIRCPTCKGVINNKWFNFRSGNVIEFVAECWSGDLEKDTPRHIFYFQIEVPEAKLYPAKGSKVFK